MAAGDEAPGVAVFAADLLACLIYAIKAVTEADPTAWAGCCIQRAYDCLWFADKRLGCSWSDRRAAPRAECVAGWRRRDPAAAGVGVSRRAVRGVATARLAAVGP
jgi:hypothetical protein